MKIKTKKEFNLPELINGAWEGDIKYGEYKSHRGISVFVWSLGFESLKSVTIQADELFTVTVEEELKMNTKIPLIVHMYIDSDGVERSENCYNQSIIECQFPTQSEEISLTMYSASGGDLTFIWNGSHGIPVSGVLEVSK